MPWIHDKQYPFDLRFPDEWRYRPARIMGCGTIGAIGLGGVCVILSWIGHRWGSDAIPRGTGWIGLLLIALGGLMPTLYAAQWLSSPERRSSLPRLVGDLSSAGTIFTGPNGQWIHLTADPLSAHERPMDRWEMEAAFQRRYGDSFIDQGWMPGSSGLFHWGKYRLGGRPHKKYTIYITAADGPQFEVVLTAKLGVQGERTRENDYDEIAQSVRCT